jgi:hypothetical protein
MIENNIVPIVPIKSKRGRKPKKDITELNIITSQTNEINIFSSSVSVCK